MVVFLLLGKEFAWQRMYIQGLWQILDKKTAPSGAAVCKDETKP